MNLSVNSCQKNVNFRELSWKTVQINIAKDDKWCVKYKIWFIRENLEQSWITILSVAKDSLLSLWSKS